MMKKRILYVVCLSLTLLTFGCYDTYEPTGLGVIDSVVYDKTEDGGFRVYTEFIKFASTQDGGGGIKSFIVVTGEGDTVRQAVLDTSSTMELRIYGGHNRVRFISEAFAREGVAPLLDYIIRDYITDERARMVVIKGPEPEKIYEASTSLSKSTGMYLARMDKTHKDETSMSVFVSTLQFIRDCHTKGKNPVMGTIEIQKMEPAEGEPSAQGGESEGGGGSKGEQYDIIYEGLAAFKGTKLAGYFDGVETRAYNILTNNLSRGSLNIDYRGGQLVLEIYKSNGKIKTTVDGSNIAIDVSVSMKLDLLSAETEVQIQSAAVQHEIEQVFNEKLRQEIAAAIAKAQTEFRSDIFGFGTYVHSQHPREWRELESGWDEVFAEAKVSVTVESDIKREGQLKQPFFSEDML
jgi:spore germination protein KC